MSTNKQSWKGKANFAPNLVRASTRARNVNSSIINSRRCFLRDRQLEHLIKLRTKGEEMLSSRLQHAEEDCKRAIDRAERGEAQIQTLEQEIADLRQRM